MVKAVLRSENDGEDSDWKQGNDKARESREALLIYSSLLNLKPQSIRGVYISTDL